MRSAHARQLIYSCPDSSSQNFAPAAGGLDNGTLRGDMGAALENLDPNGREKEVLTLVGTEAI
jgi:hypothetical protein